MFNGESKHFSTDAMWRKLTKQLCGIKKNPTLISEAKTLIWYEA